MMSCDQTRELILTDHMDGCLKEELKPAFERHLKQCSACRNFLAEAGRDLAVPFMRMERERMPASVKRAVIGRLREERELEENRAGQGFWEKCYGVIFGHVPVMAAMAGVLVCLTVAGLGIQTIGAQQARQEETGIFLAQTAAFSSGKEVTASDYGTSMEDFFLEERGES